MADAVFTSCRCKSLRIHASAEKGDELGEAITATPVVEMKINSGDAKVTTHAKNVIHGACRGGKTVKNDASGMIQPSTSPSQW